MTLFREGTMGMERDFRGFNGFLGTDERDLPGTLERFDENEGMALKLRKRSAVDGESTSIAPSSPRLSEPPNADGDLQFISGSGDSEPSRSASVVSSISTSGLWK